MTLEETIRPRLMPSGDTALVIEFGDTIDRAINARVIALADRIWNAKIAGVVEMVPTFRSLMVHYDPDVILYGELAAQIQAMLTGLEAVEHANRLWTLPTCFGGEYGPDLDEVAQRTGLSPAQVIATLTAETYQVYCIGFLPGWPYMGDVPDKLSLPRRENPRTKVPMGAVCIAQKMTGVYPLESPGGWHLLGRTPVRMFDKRRRHSVLLSPGDEVRYAPISQAEFVELDAKAEAGLLELVPTEQHT